MTDERPSAPGSYLSPRVAGMLAPGAVLSAEDAAELARAFARFLDPDDPRLQVGDDDPEGAER